MRHCLGAAPFRHGAACKGPLPRPFSFARTPAKVNLLGAGGSVPTVDALIRFAAQVRADRLRNPQISGEGTALELLIAPRFQTLVETVLPDVTVDPPGVLPEYRQGGIGRPDIAFAREATPARAFIELKQPGNTLDTNSWVGHDKDQFKRFTALQDWALTNFVSIRRYEHGRLVDEAALVPLPALDPQTSAATADRLIREVPVEGFERILQALALAHPQPPRDAESIAALLGYAARFVRDVVLEQARVGFDPVFANVRDEFNRTLFARAEAGGYDVRDSNTLFASAFAQTLLFGLLLAREAGGGEEIDHDAFENLSDATYPLLRGTLQALTLHQVRQTLGSAFDVALDAVNTVNTDLLVPDEHGRDPVLYLYENFLRIFDPSAVAKYGVYYTPPQIVRLIVGETDRALRDGLGTDGLLDENVRLLDPACGTGTFLIGGIGAAAAAAEQRFGAGMVGPVVSSFGQRSYGFELLVGPYTVAHYRVLREIASRGGGVQHVPIYLTDTLAPPAADQVMPNLAFLGAPMVAEREAADDVKRASPILAIIGNPPYKRLRGGEVERLIGRDMDRRWQDLKQPVMDAGFGRSMNPFPDLYVAFYRWALWRLFEAEADPTRGRGVLAFISNRSFLTGTAFGGLRQMLRQKFDRIRIIDFHGDSQGALPATVTTDQNVFNIKVGVCVLIAYATGEKDAWQEAEVTYASVWDQGAFTRDDKLRLAARLGENFDLPERQVNRSGMAPLKPAGFDDHDWAGVHELFTFRSNGIVTYRDHFVYATTAEALGTRMRDWLLLNLDEAKAKFKDSAMNKTGPALRAPFNGTAIREASYRPLDRRYLYFAPEYVDRPRPELQRVWGSENHAIISLPRGTGEGSAAWSHSAPPDQHSFRGSYGGWIFPLYNPDPTGTGHFLIPQLTGNLELAYREPVTPSEVFDAILALLSATSYTTRYARDLEDDFPHVPFPTTIERFREAARIGARVRVLEGFKDKPAAEFRNARLEGDAAGAPLDVPTPSRAFAGDEGHGAITLVEGTDFRIDGVSQRAWEFHVSGYQVLYKWLKARDGQPTSGAAGVALLREALDIIARVEELIHCFDEADALLPRDDGDTLTRTQIGLGPCVDLGFAQENGEDAEAAV